MKIKTLYIHFPEIIAQVWAHNNQLDAKLIDSEVLAELHDYIEAGYRCGTIQVFQGGTPKDIEWRV